MPMAFELSPIFGLPHRYSQDRSNEIDPTCQRGTGRAPVRGGQKTLLRTPVAISGDGVERTGFHVTDPDGIDVHERKLAHDCRTSDRRPRIHRVRQMPSGPTTPKEGNMQVSKKRAERCIPYVQIATKDVISFCKERSQTPAAKVARQWLIDNKRAIEREMRSAIKKEIPNILDFILFGGFVDPALNERYQVSRAE
jgi:hypothetical protein